MASRGFRAALVLQKVRVLVALVGVSFERMGSSAAYKSGMPLTTYTISVATLGDAVKVTLIG